LAYSVSKVSNVFASTPGELQVLAIKNEENKNKINKIEKKKKK
jgi:hypothetical protein